jgi:hypothetical protein
MEHTNQSVCLSTSKCSADVAQRFRHPRTKGEGDNEPRTVAITVSEAAEYLNLSERQVQRLKGMHNAEDASWVYHGNQGRDPDTHLHEKLTKGEGFILSRPTVQRILRDAGLSSPQKRRPPKYRSRRERREQEGMLLQVDGSRHDRLEVGGLLRRASYRRRT